MPKGIFEGLSSLNTLELSNNALTALPKGIFEGLSPLYWLELQNNAVNPLLVPLTLKKVRGKKQFKAVAPTGAPFDIVLPLSVTNGSIKGEGTLLKIPKGSVTSEPFSVRRTADTTDAVTVNIGDPLPVLPSNHKGYALAKSDTLPLTVIPGVAGAPAASGDPASQVPNVTVLLVNYPNPFNPETWIPYQLSKPAQVTVTLYNIQGVIVRELALGHKPAGVYRSRSRAAHWDGRNASGEKVATGVYFYTLTAGDYNATRKMLIRK